MARVFVIVIQAFGIWITHRYPRPTDVLAHGAVMSEMTDRAAKLRRPAL